VRGKHRFLLGVVHRGSRWLDGIIFEPLGRKRSHGIAEVIKESPYFKELRYIINRRSDLSPIDGGHLNAALILPVIKYEIIRGKMSHVESWGIEKEVAMAILHAFKSEKSEPFAAYLADLLKTAVERHV
jgi:endonuclease V-like protein UPF0215 family